MSRQSIDIFYMKMAYLVSERATCIRRKVGRNKRKNKTNKFGKIWCRVCNAK